jgi:hypothetical protein
VEDEARRIQAIKDLVVFCNRRELQSNKVSRSVGISDGDDTEDGIGDGNESESGDASDPSSND